MSGMHVQDAATEPPPRRRPSGPPSLLAVALVVVVVAVVGYRLNGGATSTPPAPASPTYLYWSGSAISVDISVTTSGGTTTYSGRLNNGVMRMPASSVIVSVQAALDDHGTVSCQLVHGTQTVSNHADGVFAVATCSN